MIPKLSVSNLLFRESLSPEIAEAIAASGIVGVEFAPTIEWGSTSRIPSNKLSKTKTILEDNGLEVSGLQSILFDHPEIQILRPASWGPFLAHLESVCELASWLGASTLVFGSPKNRLRGATSADDAREIAVELLGIAEATLQRYELTLTLEPNAPLYGADFITTYEEAVAIVHAVSSPYIATQLDTGNLCLSGENLVGAFRRHTPRHIHLSAPDLRPPSPGREIAEFMRCLHQSDYAGWVTLEALGSPSGCIDDLLAVLKSFVAIAERDRDVD